MITVELIENINQIRRTDNDYPSHLICDFEVYGSQYFQELQLLLQEAERLQLKNQTKYFAKKYFDIFLSKHSRFTHENAILVIITCLRTASKFNEVSHISELYTLEYCFQQSAGKYTKDTFIWCQFELLKALDFKLRMTSPYDFVVVKTLLPHIRHAMNILNSIIDFALSLPELRVVSAESIFFGALIYSCQKKKQNPMSYDIMKAITHKWQQANQIAIMLDENLKRLLQE